jgi:hypothetical protein
VEKLIDLVADLLQTQTVILRHLIEDQETPLKK